MSEVQKSTDVIVIGAGFAGIAAAKKLNAAGKDFVLLEARDRIGGRVETQMRDCGAQIELGAQWIGPTQTRIWNWVKEFDVQTFDTYDEGKNILHYKGKTSTYKGTIPKIDPISLIDLGIAIEKANKLCKSISLEQPWSHPKAAEWDAMTLATWIKKNVHTAKARHLFNIGVETVFACGANEISFLHALFYFRSGDNMDSLISIANGAQQTLLIGGTQGLLKKVSAAFHEKIVLSAPVSRIEQSENGVAVHTSKGIFKAKKVIVAVPPSMMGGIQFSPILPQRKAQLYQRMPMGAAMKSYIIYPTPFWRDKGFSGQIVSDRAPLQVTFDCSKPGGPGIMLFFVEGFNARTFIEQPFEVRKQKVIEEMVFHFGDEAKNFIDYTDRCWTEEEYTRGCYAGNFPPGVWTQFGEVVRTPFQNIHWAGTETAARWNGYMDGAIESGERAANEVLIGPQ